MPTYTNDLTVTVVKDGGWGNNLTVHVAPTPEADHAATAFLGRFAAVNYPEGDMTAWPELQNLYYPVCEHGMDGNLCYGPSHYCSDEEIRQGW
jgi:hypothetical protein